MAMAMDIPAVAAAVAPTPPSSNRTSNQMAAACQLLADDCDTDTDVSVHQLTDDEGGSGIDDDSVRASDFKMGIQRRTVLGTNSETRKIQFRFSTQDPSSNFEQHPQPVSPLILFDKARTVNCFFGKLPLLSEAHSCASPKVLSPPRPPEELWFSEEQVGQSTRLSSIVLQHLVPSYLV